jgi:hypothetical protein
MNDYPRNGDLPALTMRLELHLDRQPMSGRLCTEQGAETSFVGWLGFLDALERLRSSQVEEAECSQRPRPEATNNHHERSF